MYLIDTIVLQALATARMKGEFPERIGLPECQAWMHFLLFLQYILLKLCLANEYVICNIRNVKV